MFWEMSTSCNSQIWKIGKDGVGANIRKIQLTIFGNLEYGINIYSREDEIEILENLEYGINIYQKT